MHGGILPGRSGRFPQGDGNTLREHVPRGKCFIYEFESALVGPVTDTRPPNFQIASYIPGLGEFRGESYIFAALARRANQQIAVKHDFLV
jgi:hypothetical protein